VRLSQLMLRNVRRSPLRTGMTVMTVAIMLAAFIFPRTLVDAQDEQIRQTPNDRVVTRPKLGWGGTLPLSYIQSIGELPGINLVVGGRFAGLRVPAKERVFFQAQATDIGAFLAMHTELVVPPEQRDAFSKDERSVMIGTQLAELLDLKLGDRVTLEGTFLPGKWEVTVAAICRSTREGFGDRWLWLHYDHYNRGLPVADQDRINIIAARIDQPNQGGRIATEIDAKFTDSQFETLSLEDKVLTASLVGRFRAILDALDAVSYLILVVVMSMLSNTLAINVRERTREYGVMRAIGFGRGQLVWLVLGEAAVLGLVGSLIGLGISYPLFEGLVSRVLRDALQFPPIEVPLRVALTAVALGAGVSMVSAWVPAYRVSQLGITESLRRVA